MSIVERIRQIQEEQARKAAEAEATWKVSSKRAKEARFTEEVENVVREQKMIAETHIPEHLQKIEDSLLGQEKHHKIFKRRNYGMLSFQLAWGFYSSQLKGDHIVGHNFNSIDVDIRLDSELMSINGKELPAEIWRKNPTIIEEALALAFITPNRNGVPQWPNWR